MTRNFKIACELKPNSTKQLKFFAINPFFYNCASVIFKEVCRLSHATMLIFQETEDFVPSIPILTCFHTSIPKFYSVKDSNLNLSLRYFEKKMYSYQKLSVNNRIVLVGASVKHRKLYFVCN